MPPWPSKVSKILKESQMMMEKMWTMVDFGEFGPSRPAGSELAKTCSAGWRTARQVGALLGKCDDDVGLVVLLVYAVPWARDLCAR